MVAEVTKKWAWVRVASALAALSLLGYSSSAQASLRRGEVSVHEDAAQMGGVAHSRPQASYVVYEFVTRHQTVVREYVSQAGAVFGVAWKGPFAPDLQQLMGPHFSTLQAEVQRRRSLGLRDRKAIHLVSSGLVLHSVGHGRSQAGRAYLPDLLPPGVSSEVVQ
jgi:hypothetical protein